MRTDADRRNWHKWYKKNRKVHIERVRAYRYKKRIEIRSYIWELKGKTPCRCGENRPECLDFHHVRGKKTAPVANTNLFNDSLKRVKAEIAKCDIVCANCHRAEHYKRKETNRAAGSLNPS